MVLAIESTGWVYAFLFCLALGLAAWVVLLWGIRSGQFRNSDDVADRMLELEHRERAEPERRSEER
jgi:cbb3-type cytochrome oxidase maturation protein